MDEYTHLSIFMLLLALRGSGAKIRVLLSRCGLGIQSYGNEDTLTEALPLCLIPERHGDYLVFASPCFTDIHDESQSWSLNIYSQLHIFKWFQYFSRWRWCSFDLVTGWPWIRCDFGWSTTYAGTIIVSKHEYNRTINWTYTYPGIVFRRFGWRSESSLSVGKGRARIGAIAAVTRMNKRDSLIWTMLNK